ncbi:nicotinamide-nucleotide amidase [Arthrobacter pigmenti]|uniref:Nicotinamide-nucleotide amidase n=1 Tax=Arthrobacter pigmenti TaxID=271432 RepID=A0A846RJW3_9MICC|nr:nicotinamide-nucleotide amidase [Arthrobacter pigmenti]
MIPVGDGKAAHNAVDLARRLGVTLATAESLTAGMVSALLATVPGVSTVLRGGIVSYHRDLKETLLGVDPDLLDRVGAVDPQVAKQMAEGARRICEADVGIATTGVAGPEPHEGKSVGTVFIAVAMPDGAVVCEFTFAGDRSQIRNASCEAALNTLYETLTASAAGTNVVPQ